MTTVNDFGGKRVRIVMRRKHGRPRGHKRAWVYRDNVIVKTSA